jgi:predicted HNH restriction endonuclease
MACGVDLKERYGLDEEFIHVHHIVPLGTSEKSTR